jgi:hypothetical protein
MSKLNQEEAWISTWSDLAKAMATLSAPFFLLPDGTESTEVGMKDWIQDQAYSGWTTQIQIVYYNGRRSIQCLKGPEI